MGAKRLLAVHTPTQTAKPTVGQKPLNLRRLRPFETFNDGVHAGNSSSRPASDRSLYYMNSLTNLCHLSLQGAPACPLMPQTEPTCCAAAALTMADQQATCTTPTVASATAKEHTATHSTHATIPAAET